MPPPPLSARRSLTARLEAVASRAYPGDIPDPFPPSQWHNAFGEGALPVLFTHFDKVLTESLAYAASHHAPSDMGERGRTLLTLFTTALNHCSCHDEEMASRLGVLFEKHVPDGEPFRCGLTLAVLATKLLTQTLGILEACTSPRCHEVHRRLTPRCVPHTLAGFDRAMRVMVRYPAVVRAPLLMLAWRGQPDFALAHPEATCHMVPLQAWTMMDMWAALDPRAVLDAVPDLIDEVVRAIEALDPNQLKERKTPHRLRRLLQTVAGVDPNRLRGAGHTLPGALINLLHSTEQARDGRHDDVGQDILGLLSVFAPVPGELLHHPLVAQTLFVYSCTEARGEDVFHPPASTLLLGLMAATWEWGAGGEELGDDDRRARAIRGVLLRSVGAGVLPAPPPRGAAGVNGALSPAAHTALTRLRALRRQDVAPDAFDGVCAGRRTPWRGLQAQCPRWPPTCYVCGSSRRAAAPRNGTPAIGGQSLLRCGGCKAAVYCGPACAKAAWKREEGGHKAECAAWRRLAAGEGLPGGLAAALAPGATLSREEATAAAAAPLVGLPTGGCPAVSMDGQPRQWGWTTEVAARVEGAGLALADVVAIVDPLAGGIGVLPAAAYAAAPDHPGPEAMAAAVAAGRAAGAIVDADGERRLMVVVAEHPARVFGFGAAALRLCPREHTEEVA